MPTLHPGAIRIGGPFTVRSNRHGNASLVKTVTLLALLAGVAGCALAAGIAVFIAEGGRELARIALQLVTLAFSLALWSLILLYATGWLRS